MQAGETKQDSTDVFVSELWRLRYGVRKGLRSPAGLCKIMMATIADSARLLAGPAAHLFQIYFKTAPTVCDRTHFRRWTTRIPCISGKVPILSFGNFVAKSWSHSASRK